jgi:hypothetical protein
MGHGYWCPFQEEPWLELTRFRLDLEAQRCPSRASSIHHPSEIARWLPLMIGREGQGTRAHHARTCVWSSWWPAGLWSLAWTTSPNSGAGIYRCPDWLPGHSTLMRFFERLYLDEVESKAGRHAWMSPCMQPAAGDAVQLPVYDCWMIDWLIASCVMLDLLI